MADDPGEYILGVWEPIANQAGMTGIRVCECLVGAVPDRRVCVDLPAGAIMLTADAADQLADDLRFWAKKVRGESTSTLPTVTERKARIGRSYVRPDFQIDPDD